MPPTKLSLEFKVKSIAAGDRHLVLVSDQGDVYVAGSNFNQQLGIDSMKKFATLTKLKVSDNDNDKKESDVKIVKAVAGLHHTLLLSDKGTV
mmetsp:Transcript_18505/g.40720  ORF Transcript_18505/g.40720 Transcript_18505/m.40720 type:complete len:92 (-) Transcript_18505:561-836(-)